MSIQYRVTYKATGGYGQTNNYEEVFNTPGEASQWRDMMDRRYAGWKVVSDIEQIGEGEVYPETTKSPYEKEQQRIERLRTERGQETYQEYAETTLENIRKGTAKASEKTIERLKEQAKPTQQQQYNQFREQLKKAQTDEEREKLIKEAENAGLITIKPTTSAELQLQLFKKQTFQQRLAEFPYEKLQFKTAEEWRKAGYEVEEHKEKKISDIENAKKYYAGEPFQIYGQYYTLGESKIEKPKEVIDTSKGFKEFFSGMPLITKGESYKLKLQKTLYTATATLGYTYAKGEKFIGDVIKKTQGIKQLEELKTKMDLSKSPNGAIKGYEEFSIPKKVGYTVLYEMGRGVGNVYETVVNYPILTFSGLKLFGVAASGVTKTLIVLGVSKAIAPKIVFGGVAIGYGTVSEIQGPGSITTPGGLVRTGTEFATWGLIGMGVGKVGIKGKGAKAEKVLKEIGKERPSTIKGEYYYDIKKITYEIKTEEIIKTPETYVKKPSKLAVSKYKVEIPEFKFYYGEISIPKRLYTATDIVPSKAIAKGRVIYAFETEELAKGWALERGYKYVYKIEPKDYIIDPKMGGAYRRVVPAATPKGYKPIQSTKREWIVISVESEKPLFLVKGKQFKKFPSLQLLKSKPTEYRILGEPSGRTIILGTKIIRGKIFYIETEILPGGKTTTAVFRDYPKTGKVKLLKTFKYDIKPTMKWTETLKLMKTKEFVSIPDFRTEIQKSVGIARIVSLVKKGKYIPTGVRGTGEINLLKTITKKPKLTILGQPVFEYPSGRYIGSKAKSIEVTPMKYKYVNYLPKQKLYIKEFGKEGILVKRPAISKTTQIKRIKSPFLIEWIERPKVSRAKLGEPTKGKKLTKSERELVKKLRMEIAKEQFAGYVKSIKRGGNILKSQFDKFKTKPKVKAEEVKKIQVPRIQQLRGKQKLYYPTYEDIIMPKKTIPITKLISKQEGITKITQVPIIEEMTGLRIEQMPKVEIKLKEELKLKVETRTKAQSMVKIEQKIFQKQKQLQEQMQRQMQGQIIQKMPSIIPKISIITTPQLPPKIPTTTRIIPPFILNEHKLRKKNRTYNVYVREGEKRGDRFVRVNEEPLPYNRAYNLGSQEADNTVGRTFRLSKSEKVTTQVDDIFRSIEHKFRPPIGKSKLYEPGTFIEKSTFAIDSMGELMGITAKGIKARKQGLYFRL